MIALFLAAVLVALLAYNRVTTVRHMWVYRNPANRTCSVCERNEVEHCHTMDDWGSGRSWWEVFHAGDPAKHS